MSSIIAGSDELKEKYGVKTEDLFVAATRITKKVFDTPEQLMVAIKEYCDSKKDARGVDITTLTKAEK